MKVIILREKGIVMVVDDVKEPSLRPDHVKVKVVAVALNPGISIILKSNSLLTNPSADWKMIDAGVGAPGCIAGMNTSKTIIPTYILTQMSQAMTIPES